MATTGFDRLYYAKITEDVDGNESYGKPVSLGKAIKADLSVELAQAILYADDAAAFALKEFKNGKLTLGVADIGVSAAQDLLGYVTDDNGVLVSVTERDGGYVAVGFRAKKEDDRYRHFWLYRVKFGIPATNLETKGDSISFKTPSIEGTVMRRNRTDAQGHHPWKSEATEGTPGLKPTVIAEWFDAVYEPIWNGAGE
jgi:phi13 family phage major tail protein